jgi:hypothetical protein
VLAEHTVVAQVESFSKAYLGEWQNAIGNKCT